MGVARDNLFCLPPAGLFESREATVGTGKRYLNYADRTDRAGAKRGGRKAPPRGNIQTGWSWEKNEATETSGNEGNP